MAVIHKDIRQASPFNYQSFLLSSSFPLWIYLYEIQIFTNVSAKITSIVVCIPFSNSHFLTNSYSFPCVSQISNSQNCSQNTELQSQQNYYHCVQWIHDVFKLQYSTMRLGPRNFICMCCQLYKKYH